MFLQAVLVSLHCTAPTPSLHPLNPPRLLLERGHGRGMCAKSLTPTLWCNTIPANPLQVFSSAYYIKSVKTADLLISYQT